MAWLFSTSSTDRLDIPASTVFDFNTNVNMLAIVYPVVLTTGDNICAWGVAGVGGYNLKINSTNGDLNFVKIAVADTASTAVGVRAIVNTWNAILAFSTTGGNSQYKRLRYDTGALGTDTTVNSAAINAPSNDPGTIGNWLSPASGAELPGHIARVSLIQGAILTDSEFIAWAYGRPINRAYKFDCHMMGYDPDTDVSGNGNNPTNTGASVSTIGGPPLAPPFGLSRGYQGNATIAGAAPTGDLLGISLDGVSKQ